MTEYLNKNNFLCVIVKIVQGPGLCVFFFFFKGPWRNSVPLITEQRNYFLANPQEP